jgi:AhpD family alkylhydroperoxidase
MVEPSEAGRVLIDKCSPAAFRSLTDLAKAVRGTTEAAGLDRILVELVNIRVSQINGCAYCLDVHTRAALRNGEDQRRLAVLPAWRDTPLFSTRERAALTIAESITSLPDPYTQDRDYAFARRWLTEDELSAVAWAATAMNAFNRVSIISKHPVRPLA